MKDLKVLYLGRNDEYRLNQGSKYLRDELATLCHVDVYGNGHIHPTLPTRRNTFITDLTVLEEEFKPDVILIFAMKNRVWHNAKKIKAPVAIIMTDPHGARSRLDWIKNDEIPMTLFKYIGGWDWWADRFFKGHKQRWLPHVCETRIFRDRGFDREYDFALMGRRHKSTYPLRYKISKWLGYASPRAINPKYKVFFKHRHKRSWGWTPKARATTGVIMGKEYAEAIARCKIFATGCSVYKYALTKHFEIMGTETLLASDAPAGESRLGFVRDYNYVHIDGDTFKGKLDYYLENPVEREKIASRGRELMVERHSSLVRAKELLGYLEELF